MTPHARRPVAPVPPAGLCHFRHGSGLCLDVTGASTVTVALIELRTCNGQSNQQWTLG
jgi:hypothetical protein